ncbi:MAG: hypothetical protein M3Y56_05840 [Armatimonadota bacterium]|nr:hypothetical protein [Armatimonadota bacterium]
MSLDVSTEMKDVIEGLVGKAGRTQSEVLRTAVALLKMVKDAGPDQTPALVDKEGRVTTRIVGV